MHDIDFGFLEQVQDDSMVKKKRVKDLFFPYFLSPFLWGCPNVPRWPGNTILATFFLAVGLLFGRSEASCVPSYKTWRPMEKYRIEHISFSPRAHSGKCAVCVQNPYMGRRKSLSFGRRFSIFFVFKLIGYLQGSFSSAEENIERPHSWSSIRQRWKAAKCVVDLPQSQWANTAASQSGMNPRIILDSAFCRLERFPSETICQPTHCMFFLSECAKSEHTGNDSGVTISLKATSFYLKLSALERIPIQLKSQPSHYKCPHSKVTHSTRKLCNLTPNVGWKSVWSIDHNTYNIRPDWKVLNQLFLSFCQFVCRFSVWLVNFWSYSDFQVGSTMTNL